MLRIAKSLSMIAIVAALAIGATSAVFTSQASVTSNTFATGTLQIRVDGQASIPGFTFTNAAPGDSVSGSFTLQNYGAPWFAGPSTLPARSILMSVDHVGGSGGLFNSLQIEMTKSSGSTEVLYSGPLNAFYNKDALMSWLHPAGLAAGNSETINYTITLPSTIGNALQGTSTNFDFVARASS